MLKGQLIKLYILVYLGFRFCTEFIRPEPQLWLGLTAYQWAALVLAPIFIWLWRRDARRAAAAGLSISSDAPTLGQVVGKDGASEGAPAPLQDTRPR